MRYVAAYLLATLGGNKEPSASDIKAILESVGIDVDSDRLDVVIKELSGKDINEVDLSAWYANQWYNLENSNECVSVQNLIRRIYTSNQWGLGSFP